MKRLFIVGSGFTKAIDARAPLNCELMEAIRHENSAAIEKLEKRYGRDLEIALTRLDMDVAGGDVDGLNELRNNVVSAILSFFKGFRFGAQRRTIESKNWIERFIRSTITEGDVILSLNYDCLFEGVLDRYGLWSPNGGYGFGQQYPDFPDHPSSAVTVLKIHGSENFYRDVALGRQHVTVLRYNVDESLFPYSGRGYCSPIAAWTKREPAVIAPSYLKVFHSTLISLFLQALSSAEAARTLVLIGCGARREDQLLHILLWQFITGYVNDNDRRILIADPKASEVLKRINAVYEYPIDSIASLVEEPLETGWSKIARLLEDDLARP